ncbi:MAG TPA: agmatine deiminase [Xanthomonadales bacterium]|nr:agmatine deiminase [Xanthomonadales bacterium]
MSGTPPRWPAEWEPQSAIAIAWPHPGTDWAARLDQVEPCFTALAVAICARQELLLCVPDPATRHRLELRLSAAGADLARIRFVELAYDDTWLRDSGPITLIDGDGFVLLDFVFTGWGGKFAAGQDDALVAHLHGSGLFPTARHRRIDFALEGGAIDGDGRGSVLTTWRCLGERHPDASRTEIEAVLTDSLSVRRVLWLEHGHLEGDDTDAHIDTLARFAGPDRIVYQACDDPSDSHYPELAAMAAELAALRDDQGRPFRLFPLPWPRPILDAGRRLAASYANFLIVNGAVLAPSYDDPADVRAQAVLADAFPDREIVMIPCRPLIWQNGSLHCLTMQLPAGLLSAPPDHQGQPPAPVQ